MVYTLARYTTITIEEPAPFTPKHDGRRYASIENCEACRHYDKNGNQNNVEHLYFEHGLEQKPQKKRSPESIDPVAVCPDCGRTMQNWSWSYWSIDFRCKHCQFKWSLVRGNSFVYKKVRSRIYRSVKKRAAGFRNHSQDCWVKWRKKHPKQCK